MKATDGAHRGRALGLLLPVSAGLALAGAILRASAVPPAIADVDGVNFARALVAFDPLHQAPHFPGYVVYVALTSVAHALGAPELWALALPSILLWPFAAFVFAMGTSRAWGAGAGLGALLAASVAPGVVTLGAWPGSDGLGFALLVLGLGALASSSAPHARIVAGLAFGLSLGVRLTWWPLVVGAVVLSRDRRVVGATVVAVFVWALPLVALVGPRELVALALGFTSGHFASWGNTALSSDGGLLSRCARAIWDVFTAGLGGVWPGAAPRSSGGLEETHSAGLLVSLVVVIGLVAVMAEPVRRRATGREVTADRGASFAAWMRSTFDGRTFGLTAALLVGSFYLAWVLVAQNVDKPRHLVPLVPLVGALAGRGWSRLAIVARPLTSAGLVVLAAGALFVVSSARAELQRTTLAPQAAVVAEVARRSPSQLAIFAGEESRVFEHLAPMYRVMRPASAEVLVSEVSRLSALGVDVFVTSGTPGASSLPLEVVSVHRTLEVLRGPESVVVLHQHRPAASLARGSEEVLR